MNKKLALLIGILAFFTIKMTSQEYRYGIYAGAGFGNFMINSDLHYDDARVYPVINGTDTTCMYLAVRDAKLEAVPGLLIGGYYEKPLNNMAALQLHLQYHQMGYVMKGKVDQPNITDEFSVEYDYTGTLKMSNIAAAVVLKFDVSSDDISIDVGLMPSYCVKITKDIVQGTLHETKSYTKDEYNPLSISGRLGATYYFLDCFMFSGHVSMGFSDMLKAKSPYYVKDENGFNKEVDYKYSVAKSRPLLIEFTVGYRF